MKLLVVIFAIAIVAQLAEAGVVDFSNGRVEGFQDLKFIGK